MPFRYDFSLKRSIYHYSLLLFIILIFGILVSYFIDYLSLPCRSDPLYTIYLNYLNEIPKYNNNFSFILSNNIFSFLVISFLPYVFIILSVILGKTFVYLRSKLLRVQETFSLSDYVEIVPTFKIWMFIGWFLFSIKTFHLYCPVNVFPFQVIISYLIPHGIIEIFGFIISGYIGLSLIDIFYNEFRRHDDILSIFKIAFKETVVFLIIGIICIIVSACIESWITPQIVILGFKSYFSL